MAKIVLTDELGDSKWLEDYFSWNQTLESSSATKAHYIDTDTGSETVLIGVGLQFTDGAFSGGTVTAVQLLDDKGALLVDLTEGSYSPADLKVGSFWDFMSALSAGDDTITGGHLGHDLNVLGDNHGNDTIAVGDGGNYLGGTEGNDSYTAGAGWDTLSYHDTVYRDDAKKGVVLNAAKGTATDPWGDKDVFSGIEQFDGSHFKDVLVGSARGEAFLGVNGADKINGGGGTDEIQYHLDQRFGGKQGIVAHLDKGFVIDGFGERDTVSNIERVYGTYKADKFIGDDNDNMFRGVSGKDSFSGGKGMDEVFFGWWEELGQHGANVDLSLKKNQIKDDGFGNVETTKGIESIGGSELNDTLKLGKSDGWIWANDGDDTLIAGIGEQWFGGGSGADTFVFGTLDTLANSVGGNEDEIDDFSQADGDRIDLSGIGNLIFVGTAAFSNTAGELRYEQIGEDTIIHGDTDGDGKANFQLKIGQIVDLQASDLLL